MIEQYWEGIKAFAWNTVWAANLAALSPARAAAVKSLRVGHMLIREVGDGQLNVRAASLVYTTLLSLVPVMALSFALFKGFGVHHDLQPALMGYLEPLGAKGAELGNRLIAMVENVDVRSLGVLGLAFLLYTVARVVQKVEQALNYTWRVRTQRRFFERLSGYLSVVIFGPVFVFAAIFISGSFMSSSMVTHMIDIAGIGSLVTLAGKVVPYFLVVAAFTFVYFYIPNTRVNIGSALIGALIAGFLWAVAGWAFAALVVGSTRYAAIYSGFAIVVLFVMWLHVSWLILLMGGSVAFYHQHPEHLGLLTHELKFSARIMERLALLTCFLIARNFQYRLEPWTSVALARRLRVPLATVDQMMHALEKEGIVVATGSDAQAYVPARDPATVKIKDILDVARAAAESHHFSYESIASEPAVDGICFELDQAMDGALAERTLRDLVTANPPVGNDGAVSAQSATNLVTVVAERERGDADENRIGAEGAGPARGTGGERT
ncbi:MAG: YihY family inner membrane protein [Gammaproteobacteria bacterium]|nr:YihY family inner membrane protein [Gammaproteobacteria bacterium]NIM74610.1 YihY family inner membrane protein [Gammaproteobacteria bacterium]NIO26443.1 YihY family inner membrane protein [Gammaproteobacteria bacterium]NIO66995.1 YihY family inner membrane protein [Gammaproteobacteria bacterium]NIP46805.1 YihY family inner membrane protein [Gammaproteobacteria bacterium]